MVMVMVMVVAAVVRSRGVERVQAVSAPPTAACALED